MPRSGQRYNDEGTGQADMRQPDARARRIRTGDGGVRFAGRSSANLAQARADVPEPRPGDAGDQRAEPERRLPPGQYVQATMPVLHYGPVPAFNQQTWDLRVYGATGSGREHRWTWGGFRSLPRREIVADFHCVTKFTVLGLTWTGVAAAEVLQAVPQAGAATHVMVWADYGYGANLPLEVFAAAETLLATHRDDAELSPEHGYPVRLVVPSRYGWKSVKWVRAVEYMIGDRRGFWEERGYHNGADPWREQRYSYQEMPGDGPEL